MNILYYSVHQILEFDEISLFHSLGHRVFPLGSYFKGERRQFLRPDIVFDNAFHAMVETFDRTKCSFNFGGPVESIKLSEEFVSLFDVVVVMHDLSFARYVQHHFSEIPLIWRTIGVDTEALEPQAKASADRGMHIVRYSPMERRATNYAGETALIRFGKDIAAFQPWSGDQESVLLFSHSMSKRFPAEAHLFRDVTSNLDVVLGGTGNEGERGSAGVLSFQEQINLLGSCRAYFYCAGSFIPYTLNFMEAWLSGIPLVVLNPRAIYPDHVCRFAEIDLLIASGDDAVLVDSAEAARDALRLLFVDKSLAKEIGRKGQERARSLFSFGAIGPSWKKVFENLHLHP